MDFKDRIKELRKSSGMSAEQLASVFGKSKSAIGMWEVGKTKPDADTLIELSKYFGCTVDYLLGLSEFKSEEEADEYEQGMNTLLDYVLSFDHGKSAIAELFFFMKYAVEFRDSQGPEALNNLLMYIMSIGFAARAVDSAKHAHLDKESLGEYLAVLATARRRMDKAQKIAEQTTSNIFRYINAGLASLLENNFDESTIGAMLQVVMNIQQDDVDKGMAKEMIHESEMMEKAKTHIESRPPNVD